MQSSFAPFTCTTSNPRLYALFFIMYMYIFSALRSEVTFILVHRALRNARDAWEVRPGSMSNEYSLISSLAQELSLICAMVAV